MKDKSIETLFCYLQILLKKIATNNKLKEEEFKNLLTIIYNELLLQNNSPEIKHLLLSILSFYVYNDINIDNNKQIKEKNNKQNNEKEKNNIECDKWSELNENLNLDNATTVLQSFLNKRNKG